MQHMFVVCNLSLKGNAGLRLPTDLSSLAWLSVLHLSHQGLAGPLPPALGELTGLRVLDLSFNQLAGPIPHTVSALTA